MAQEHYFTQKSLDPSQYLPLSGRIGDLQLSLWSAPGVFSAKRFDSGTKILLKAFLFHTSGDLKILDLGCWYGLVSVYFAQQLLQTRLPRISSLHIDACDVSALAVDLTRYNLKNHYSKKLSYQVVQSDGLSDVVFEVAQYDSILTNPPFSAGKNIVHSFLLQGYDHLALSWKLRVVVPTKRWAKSYIKRCQEQFWEENVELQTIESGFRVWTITKPPTE